jgi:hypothetical protein
VSECDLETSKRRLPRSDLGCCATGKEILSVIGRLLYKLIVFILSKAVNYMELIEFYNIYARKEFGAVNI